jgi:hypothetical protein
LVQHQPTSLALAPQEKPDGHVHQANQEHQKRNLIDAMHHPQVDVGLFLFLEKIERIKIIQELF